MAVEKEFDVIVIGAGASGGLPAAAYLQKAGARVALIEAMNEAGRSCMTHEIIPGSLYTQCAGGCMIGMSPAMEDLELEEKYGVHMMVAPQISGGVFTDGKNLMYYYDPQKQYEEIARFSKKDADRAMRYFERFQRNVVEFDKLMFYSEPTPEGLERIWELVGDMFEINPDDARRMNAFEVLEMMFEDHHVREAFLLSAATQCYGSLGDKGGGVLDIPGFQGTFIMQCKGGNHLAVHGLVRCFLEHGGTFLRNCPVEKIIVKDGVATGVVLSETAAYPVKELTAKHAVISNLGARLTLDVVGEDVMKQADPVLAQRMGWWNYEERAGAASCWALKGFPQYKSAEWNPDIHLLHFGYKLWSGWDNVKKWWLGQKSNDLWGIQGLYMEIVCNAAIDVTQVSPEGYVTMRCEEVLPWDGFRREGGTFEMWDEKKWEILERQTDVMEELAPGFKKQIIYKHILSPVDIQRYNPVLICGNNTGGSTTADQHYLSKMPYRMPIKKLYMSNSTWPFQLSFLGTGYIAASCVAEDMEIREQPWWTHPPVAWMMKNLERNTVKRWW